MIVRTCFLFGLVLPTHSSPILSHFEGRSFLRCPNNLLFCEHLSCTYSLLLLGACVDQDAYKATENKLAKPIQDQDPKQKQRRVLFDCFFLNERTVVGVLVFFGATQAMVPLHFNIPTPHSERGRKLLGTRWLLQT